MPSSLVVRRAEGARMPSAKRSVKICRPHRTASQRKRRAIITSSTIARRRRQGPRPDVGNSYERGGKHFRMTDKDQSFVMAGR